jgi:hypothetical protein
LIFFRGLIIDTKDSISKLFLFYLSYFLLDICH